MHPSVGIALAYLLGSIPAALIAGKVTKGIDLRQHGSGNLGATNAYRVLGPKVASVVMLVDAGKGALPVIFFPRWIGASNQELWAIAIGVAAILGHVWPIFLLGRGGGKGVATASGVFLALAWLPTLLAFIVWALVLFRTGYVSLASLCAATVLPIAVALTEGFEGAQFVLAAAVVVFVFWSHRANIGRLIRGEEHRFGGKRASPPAGDVGEESRRGSGATDGGTKP
jgi:acyl phosphate:glycerol-3-phosphate acyltransferase